MKILVLNREYPPVIGGGAVACRYLCEAWVRAGHDVTVITARVGRAAVREKTGGVDIIRVGASQSELATITGVIGYVFRATFVGARQKRPDLVFSFFAIPAGPVGWFLSKLHRVRHAIFLLGGDVYEPTKSLSPHRNGILRFVTAWLLNHSQYIFSDSTDVTRAAEKYFKPRISIKTVGLGIPRPSFNVVSRRDFGLEEERTYAISLGYMIPRKNFAGLIRAWKDVNEHATLLIIGRGPEELPLKQLIADLKLESRVRLLGAVDDERKFQYLSVCDFFVSASFHEGFGLMFLEALQCGLPVIANSIGGQRDFLTDGENSLLVDVRDEAALTGTINRMVMDPVLRTRLAGHAKRTAKRYDADVIAASILTSIR